MVYLADAFWEEETLLLVPVLLFLVTVIFGKSLNFSGSQLHPLQSLEVSSVSINICILMCLQSDVGQLYGIFWEDEIILFGYFRWI